MSVHYIVCSICYTYTVFIGHCLAAAQERQDELEQEVDHERSQHGPDHLKNEEYWTVINIISTVLKLALNAGVNSLVLGMAFLVRAAPANIQLLKWSD